MNIHAKYDSATDLEVTTNPNPYFLLIVYYYCYCYRHSGLADLYPYTEFILLLLTSPAAQSKDLTFF